MISTIKKTKETIIGKAFCNKCAVFTLLVVVFIHMPTTYAQGAASIDVTSPAQEINNLDTQAFLNLIEQQPDLVVMDLRHHRNLQRWVAA